MNLSNTTLPPPLAATLLVTAAALTAALAPPIWQTNDGVHAASPLACELVPAAASGSAQLLITNRSKLPLPARSAFSWASLGTPAPLGGMQTLTQDLAPGDSVALPTGAVLHASGCLASLAASQ